MDFTITHRTDGDERHVECIEHRVMVDEDETQRSAQLRYHQSAGDEDESVAETLHASVILALGPELLSSLCVSKIRNRVLPAASIDGSESKNRSELMFTFIQKMCVFAIAAVGLYAQSTPVVPAPETRTSGMVGVVDGEVARLNVLNPGVAAPAVGVVCTATLNF